MDSLRPVQVDLKSVAVGADLQYCRYIQYCVFSWAKAPALYVTMSHGVVVEEVHFLDLAFRAQIELRNVKVKVKLR